MGLSLPVLVFPVRASRWSRSPNFGRIINSQQLGSSPVAMGLMASTCFVLARDLPGVWKGAAMIAVTLLRLTPAPPVVLILATGGDVAFVRG
ncbi:MAG: hypothetical protein C0505_18905 [Leptothrix sp. (in: Bacteria)]|nr:hypothetical protein [Leptothrix sp. (in: b-proteobacteria)]